MKALVYEKANTLEDFGIKLIEVPEPAIRELDVLVQVHAIGVNPGEAFIRKTRSAEPGGRVLLGWEFAGVVAGVGSSVSDFRIGDRVFGTGDMTRDGAWAQFVAVDHRIIAKIPDRLSYEDAASLPIGAITAWEAMFRDQDTLPRGVERVLVVGGAGAVGSLATQLLKVQSGAFVISTASRADSKDWCSKMGADLVLDHSADILAQLATREIPHVDMVLSTAKSAENIGWIAKALRPFGHMSVVDASSKLDPSVLMLKAASLHTEMVFSRILHGAAPEAHGAILASIAKWVTEGRIRPITTTRLEGLTVGAMKAAHTIVEAGRTIGKTVISV